jgi:hypothetical protein
MGSGLWHRLHFTLRKEDAESSPRRSSQGLQNLHRFDGQYAFGAHGSSGSPGSLHRPVPGEREILRPRFGRIVTSAAGDVRPRRPEGRTKPALSRRCQLPDELEILILRDLDGLSYDEIAAALSSRRNREVTPVPCPGGTAKRSGARPGPRQDR